MNTVHKAKEHGYFVTILYFWLNLPELAIERVKVRVKEGGHDIPEKIIRRRYESGIKNMFNLYIPIVDYWMFIDNSKTPFEILAEGKKNKFDIINKTTWEKLKTKYYGH